MRLDQWLWAVRLYKSRTLAVEAVRGGHVKINGLAAKPAREVHAGEVIEIQLAGLTKTVRVLGAPTARVAAKRVPEFLTDLTPPSEYLRARDADRVEVGIRPRGSGRPTKRERRKLDHLFP